MSPVCRRAVGLLTLAALALAACARVRPLSGGPPDETPPQLLASSPPDSSSFVPRTPEIRLHFDEKISTASLRRGLRTYPPLRVADVHLSGTSAVVTFVDTLPADTTWAVVLGRGVQDLPKRDNRLPREEWLLFTTGSVLQSAGVFGRIAVHGKPESKGAVVYQPLAADTTHADSLQADRAPRGRGPRYPVTATDDEGLYRLFGIPPERPFQLVAFVDGNGNLTPDATELQATTPETLQLARGEILRGMQFDLVDPNEPALVEGVVLNTTAVDASIAVGLFTVADSSAAATTTPPTGAATAADTTHVAADASRARVAPGPDSTRVDSTQVDSTRVARGAVRADTLRPLPLPVPARAESPWAAAYEALEPEGFVPARWTIVYASPRGDYSMKVPAGRHRLIAFVDASADSAPGLYVAADSTRLDWEPLWVGGFLEVRPGETRRPRAIEIQPTP